MLKIYEREREGGAVIPRANLTRTEISDGQRKGIPKCRMHLLLFRRKSGEEILKEWEEKHELTSQAVRK